MSSRSSGETVRYRKVNFKVCATSFYFYEWNYYSGQTFGLFRIYLNFCNSWFSDQLSSNACFFIMYVRAMSWCMTPHGSSSMAGSLITSSISVSQHLLTVCYCVQWEYHTNTVNDHYERIIFTLRYKLNPCEYVVITVSDVGHVTHANISSKITYLTL